MSKQTVKEYRQKVADAFVNALEKDSLEWKKGWILSCNATTGKEYKGINLINLSLAAREKGYTDPRWATFKQIQEHNWSLEKGAKGEKVEYWTPYNMDTRKYISWEEYREINKLKREGEPGPEIKLFAQYYTVFNAQFIKGIEPMPLRDTEHPSQMNELVKKASERMNVEILNDGGVRAFYSPGEDRIHLPEAAAFLSEYDYFATAWHELAHASGAANRLNRDLTGAFGSEKYAYEELIAEISSMFMSDKLSIEQSQFHVENHAAYVQSWISAIKKDPDVLVRAIYDAEKAADYLEYQAGLVTLKEAERNVQSTMKVPENSVGSELENFEARLKAMQLSLAVADPDKEWGQARYRMALKRLEKMERTLSPELQVRFHDRIQTALKSEDARELNLNIAHLFGNDKDLTPFMRAASYTLTYPDMFERTVCIRDCRMKHGEIEAHIESDAPGGQIDEWCPLQNKDGKVFFQVHDSEKESVAELVPNSFARMVFAFEEYEDTFKSAESVNEHQEEKTDVSNKELNIGPNEKDHPFGNEVKFFVTNADFEKAYFEDPQTAANAFLENVQRRELCSLGVTFPETDSSLSYGIYTWMPRYGANKRIEPIVTELAQKYTEIDDIIQRFRESPLLYDVETFSENDLQQFLSGEETDFSHRFFEKIDFGKVDLHGIDFTGSYFKNCDFLGTDLSGSDFKGAVITDTSFDEVDLSGASFHYAQIHFIGVKDTNLIRTDFENASFRECHFWGNTVFEENNFRGATFEDVTFSKSLKIPDSLLHAVHGQDKEKAAHSESAQTPALSPELRGKLQDMEKNGITFSVDGKGKISAPKEAKEYLNERELEAVAGYIKGTGRAAETESRQHMAPADENELE